MKSLGSAERCRAAGAAAERRAAEALRAVANQTHRPVRVGGALPQLAEAAAEERKGSVRLPFLPWRASGAGPAASTGSSGGRRGGQ